MEEAAPVYQHRRCFFFCACHMGPVSVIVVRCCPSVDEIPKSDDAVCGYGKIRHRRDACVQYGNADAFSCGEWFLQNGGICKMLHLKDPLSDRVCMGQFFGNEKEVLFFLPAAYLLMKDRMEGIPWRKTGKQNSCIWQAGWKDCAGSWDRIHHRRFHSQCRQWRKGKSRRKCSWQPFRFWIRSIKGICMWWCGLWKCGGC